MYPLPNAEKARSASMDNTQDNDTTTENKIGTVSIRKMHLHTWYKAGFEAKMNGITIAEYIKRLITEDLELGEIISNGE